MLGFVKKIIKKQPHPTYIFDVTDVCIYDGQLMGPKHEVVDWLNKNVCNWRGEFLWLYNPVDSDIIIYRIYFPDDETLTQFKLTWQKGELLW